MIFLQKHKIPIIIFTFFGIMIFIPNFTLLHNAFENWRGYEKKNRFVKDSKFVEQNIKNKLIDIKIYQKISIVGENKIFIKAQVLNKNKIAQEGKFKVKLIRPLDYTKNEVHIANYDGTYFYKTITLKEKGNWRIMSHFENAKYNYKTVTSHFNK